MHGDESVGFQPSVEHRMAADIRARVHSPRSLRTMHDFVAGGADPRPSQESVVRADRAAYLYSCRPPVFPRRDFVDAIRRVYVVY